MILKILKSLFSFRGRISRGKFIICFFGLIFISLFFAGMMLDENYNLDTVFRDFIRRESLFDWYKEHFVFLTFLFIVLIIELSLIVRRLHDLGRSGWTLINPFKNPLRELDIFFKSGDSNQNQYDS